MGGGGARAKYKKKNIHALAPKQIRTKNSSPPPPISFLMVRP